VRERKNHRWYLAMKAIDKHLYRLLLPLGVAFIVLSLTLPKFRLVQAGLAISFIYIYIGFSLLHHKEDKSLTLEVTLEYILLATLTLVLILGVLI
jgi:small-conductance mechanosensitive channel